MISDKGLHEERRGMSGEEGNAGAITDIIRNIL